MIVTTTPTVEGRQVADYLGVVSGEAIMGANFFRDFLAGIRDIIGGRAGAWEEVMQTARETALAEMQAHAVRLGADAVIGVQLSFNALGSTDSMLMVAASGTAVKLR
jgi:uncharacterized protein YbjQ (UPF0145 family)